MHILYNNIIFKLLPLIKMKLQIISSKNICKDVMKRYHVGKNFTVEYLKSILGKDYNSIYTNVDELYSRVSELSKTHIDYALSTNFRGHNVVKQLKPYLKKHHKRHLDIGCAYGGFVVAFTKAGYDSFGLEIDDFFYNCGKLNCYDHNIAGKILQGDILEINITDIGTFDIITCNDVIEHVHDAGTTIYRISQLLNTNGALFMAIPNKHAIDLVTSDGHFQLFGITLLSRENAKQYKYEMTGVVDDYNHMGDSYTIDYYINEFNKYNLSIKMHNEHKIPDYCKIQESICKLKYEYDQWIINCKPKLSDMIADIVIFNYKCYLDELLYDYERYKKSMDTRNFELKYLINVWEVIGIKI